MRSNSRTSVIIAGVAILSIVALLERRINALSWRLVGEDETGLTLQSAPRLSPAEIQAVIRKTRLHRQLAEHQPELTSPR